MLSFFAGCNDKKQSIDISKEVGFVWVVSCSLPHLECFFTVQNFDPTAVKL